MTEISRRQFALYAVAVVLVVLIGGRALRAGGSAVEAPASGDPGAFTAVAPGPADAAGGGRPGTGRTPPTGATGVVVTGDDGPVVVHVAGAVRHPGVYTLTGGARVQDALRKAGGGRHGADLDALNLAAKATDGQQIVVARRVRGARAGAATAAAPPATAAGTTGAGAAAAGPVNVNTADATQLEALNGVGPAIAAKIVAWRTQNGPFKSADDLAQVAGIGPKKLEAMRAQVVT